MNNIKELINVNNTNNVVNTNNTNNLNNTNNVVNPNDSNNLANAEINSNNNNMLINNNTLKNVPVDINSQIPLHKRWNSHNTEAPISPNNGGLFGGEQAVGPYASIPVIPTATNMINKNLLSAGPPPGATEQYIGTNRSNNNYVPMPGVYWYNDTHPVNKGPYSMKVVNK